MWFRNTAMMIPLSFCLALPVAAQTLQTKPNAPASSAISPSSGSPTAGSPSSGSPSSGSPNSGRLTPSANQPGRDNPATGVDINTASAAQLDELPGIGKARADAIIKNRPYRQKDDLVNRHILPQNVYEGIKNKIVAGLN